MIRGANYFSSYHEVSEGTPGVTDDTLVDDLVRLSFLVQQQLTEVAQHHGVTVQQLRLLAILSDREPTMAYLAELMGLERSSLSGLVDRAQRADLVQRTSATHDRRAIHVSLTPTGRALHDTLHADVTQRLRAFAAALPAQHHATLATLLHPLTGVSRDSAARVPRSRT
jgi:DNA-binding MarR family transcriptional regulator